MSKPQDEYLEKVIRICATFLERWKDSNAIMWELTASHKSLRVVLTRGEEGDGNLLLSCLDPRRVRGPVRWQHSNLSVSRASLDASDEGFVVRDSGADVEILCGGIEVKENVKLY